MGYFGGLIFGPQIFWGFVGSPRVFLGFSFLPPFDHPGHLKSGVPPTPPPPPPPLGVHFNVKNSKVLLGELFMYEASKSTLFAAGRSMRT